MTREISKEHGGSFFRKVFRFIFWPVRHWILTLVTLALLVAAYAITVQILQSKLDALHTAAKAAGEATRIEDFQVKDLTDENNAAVVYRRAQSLFRLPDDVYFDRNKIWRRYIASNTADLPQEDPKGRGEKTPSGSLAPDELTWVNSYVTINNDAFKAIQEASKKPFCQFFEYSDPSKVFSEAQASRTSMSTTGVLTQSIAIRAVWEARQGNTDAAYEWIGHGLHLVNALHNDSLLIGELMRLSANETIMSACNTVMCDTLWTGNIPEKFQKELMQILDRNLFARSFEGERFFSTSNDNISKSGPQIVIIPLLIAHYSALSDIILAAREPDFAKRLSLIDQIKQKYTEPSDGILARLRADKRMAQIEVPNLMRVLEQFDRAEAQAQNARQVMALKRYKQTHGQYPDTLQQLISGDFKALPIDPFNGEPYHYKKEGEGFLLYSIGPNRVDDGGISGSRMDGDYVWRVTQ